MGEIPTGIEGEKQMKKSDKQLIATAKERLQQLTSAIEAVELRNPEIAFDQVISVIAWTGLVAAPLHTLAGRLERRIAETKRN